MLFADNYNPTNLAQYFSSFFGNNSSYTWNEGASFIDCEFSSELIQVSNIFVSPTPTTQNFILHGVSSINSGIGQVFFFNFENLHERSCEPDDYEYWSPFDNKYLFIKLCCSSILELRVINVCWEKAFRF
jgi:hypothetical protein